MQTRNWKIN